MSWNKVFKTHKGFPNLSTGGRENVDVRSPVGSKVHNSTKPKLFSLSARLRLLKLIYTLLQFSNMLLHLIYMLLTTTAALLYDSEVQLFTTAADLYASAVHLYHYRSYLQLVAGDRTHYSSSFLLVLRIGPTTDSIVSLCWG